MAIRVAINGFGRIGRLVFRVLTQNSEFEVVAINDLTDAATLAMLTKYDSVHGRFRGTVGTDGNALVINGTKIPVLAERNPSELPWGEMKVDFAVESTGVFPLRYNPKRGNQGYGSHLDAGAKRVLLTVPAKDEIDATIVMGVNQDSLRPEHKVISNASCTTNCLGPIAKVLHEKFGIRRGLMTTVHAYTNDQQVADQVHSDLRRARAAAVNIIPTSTGAARAIGQVIPELAGKLDGMAMRVPVPDGSIVDLVVDVDASTTAEEVNAAMKEAAESHLKGILEYSEDPLVSSDIIGNTHSSILDAQSTTVMDGNMVKVISWYDNEWGYSNRVVDLMAYASKNA
ncbi:MAG: type I glyceraldehyde-3-phosphate dehydrogenase [Planctomycetota bacterium]|nr:type I glyceraldehyde-3-phosphate dehydrogenase [Planctomycetota bacterium]MDA1142825.1 type I glyceraldehyde-3-phosphate dehydrogenase [Planctomycetota bacterium]